MEKIVTLKWLHFKKPLWRTYASNKTLYNQTMVSILVQYVKVTISTHRLTTDFVGGIYFWTDWHQKISAYIYSISVIIYNSFYHVAKLRGHATELPRYNLRFRFLIFRRRWNYCMFLYPHYTYDQTSWLNLTVRDPK